MSNSNLGPVVRKMDIHWINHYLMDSAIDFPNSYLVDSAIQHLNNQGLEISFVGSYVPRNKINGVKT